MTTTQESTTEALAKTTQRERNKQLTNVGLPMPSSIQVYPGVPNFDPDMPPTQESTTSEDFLDFMSTSDETFLESTDGLLPRPRPIFPSDGNNVPGQQENSSSLAR